MTPLPSEQKRRTRRAAPKPVQLDLPLDLAAAVSSSIARFQVPPERPAQPAPAQAVAAETTMQNEARRTLAENSGKPATKHSKPKVRTTEP